MPASPALHGDDHDGRDSYQDLHHFVSRIAEADSRIFGDDPAVPSREEVLEAYIPYVARQLAQGEHLHRIVRHILGL